jgi:YspA, cpYpsA-related SLOG family
MKVVIAGSRNISDQDPENYKLLIQTIKRTGYDIDQVVCGMAAGIDKLGQKYALVNNIPVIEMPANWNAHGKAAGPIRNRKMAEVADAAIVIWDGKSPGTLNMITEINKLNKPCYIRIVT